MQQLAGSFRSGRPMIRITLSYVWQLSEQLERLNRIEGGANAPMSKMDIIFNLLEAQNSLDALLQGSVFSPTLRISRQLAINLLTQLREATSTDWDKEFERNEVWRIRVAYREFKTAFLAELGTFPTFFVTQKGSHDSLTLLESPQLMFPNDLATKVPEATYDVGEAGKALCYEIATSAGFHLFRIIESVLRRYYSHESGGRPQPKVRNISVYVNSMRQLRCGDEKILSVVEQISKLHRNPLIHPEAIITIDEALSILGMARSAVTAMLSVLPDVPPTTSQHGEIRNEEKQATKRTKRKVIQKRSN